MSYLCDLCEIRQTNNRSGLCDWCEAARERDEYRQQLMDEEDAAYEAEKRLYDTGTDNAAAGVPTLVPRSGSNYRR